MKRNAWRCSHIANAARDSSSRLVPSSCRDAASHSWVPPYISPYILVEGAAVFPTLELRSRTLPSAMPADASQTAPQASPSVVCAGAQRQRDPEIFSGTDENDVEDWLESYERVSATNKWDNPLKLSNVIFYLTGVAKLWFTNHEADLLTWPSFKTSIANVFGRPGVRKLRAEQRLRCRSQQSGETFTSYIEDVIDLCRRADPTMAEADKVRHIMKGISDDAFHMLLSKNPGTVSQVTELCQSFDELRRQRLLTRRRHMSDETRRALSPLLTLTRCLARSKSSFVPRSPVSFRCSRQPSDHPPPLCLQTSDRPYRTKFVQLCHRLARLRRCRPPLPTPR